MRLRRPVIGTVIRSAQDAAKLPEKALWLLQQTANQNWCFRTSEKGTARQAQC